MKYFLIKFIKLYQNFWPRQKTCIFYPTCSSYTILAIEKYGSIKGLFFGFKRILRCHPWSEPRVDKP